MGVGGSVPTNVAKTKSVWDNGFGGRLGGGTSSNYKPFGSTSEGGSQGLGAHAARLDAGIATAYNTCAIRNHTKGKLSFFGVTIGLCITFRV